MRGARILAIVAGGALAVLAIASGAGAKPEKPPKPKPKLELLTETQRGALRTEAVKVAVTSKRGDEVRVKGRLLVEAFPEDYSFRLRPESAPLRNRRAKLRIDLSVRQHEVLAFAEQACDGASLSLEARAAGQTGKLRASLRKTGC